MINIGIPNWLVFLPLAIIFVYLASIHIIKVDEKMRANREEPWDLFLIVGLLFLAVVMVIIAFPDLGAVLL